VFVVVGELPEMMEAMGERDPLDLCHRRICFEKRAVRLVEPLSLQESQRGHSGHILESVTQGALADAKLVTQVLNPDRPILAIVAAFRASGDQLTLTAGTSLQLRRQPRGNQCMGEQFNGRLRHLREQ
jgi:hypothetical protein